MAPRDRKERIGPPYCPRGCIWPSLELPPGDASVERSLLPSARIRTLAVQNVHVTEQPRTEQAGSGQTGSEQPRSAIVVPFALPARLEAIRQDHVDNARLGVPAHVTLLFPFIPANELAPSDIDLAAAVVRRTRGFEATFRQAMTFAPTEAKEGVVWLAPEPPEPFVALTNQLADAFPAHPPYGGIHDTVIPHLTLANVDVDIAGLVEASRSELPFERRVDVAALLVEDATGHWRIARELPLG